MFLIKMLEFIVEFFTHITIRRVIGGVLLLIGLGLVSRADMVSSINEVSLRNGIAGIFIGGVGVVIIMYDTAQSKHYSDVKTLEKAYKDREHQDSVSAWHIKDDAKDKG